MMFRDYWKFSGGGRKQIFKTENRGTTEVFSGNRESFSSFFFLTNFNFPALQMMFSTFLYFSGCWRKSIF